MKKQIKRVISTFLSLLMIVGIVNFSSLTAKAANVADIFDDVEAGKWYVNAIQFVYDRGLMVGTSSNTFGVHQKLQREQFAQILYSMAGKPFLTHGWENPFSDVPNEPGYPRDAIIWAYTNGIAVGNRNGTFGVGEAIQREAVSVMLYKYAVKFGFDLTTNIEALDGFSDMPKISTWAVETMQWAVTQGIISGKTDTTLDPLGYATRAECAAMIMRLINKNSGTKPKVGDIMTIGHYEQDGVIENGKEPIEWQVLKVESNRVLLVSKYVLDYQWMDELNGFVRTWSSCNLRYWLNCDFKNTAFSSSEMARIPTVIIKPEINETFPEIPVGVDSYDKVFCLSMNELNELFEINYRASNNNPKYLLYSQYFIAAPTQYCKNRGAYEFTITENDYNYLSGFNYTRDVIGLRGTQWWTRTPGNISNNEFCYCYVSQYGESGEGYSIQTRQHFGVRPAIYYYY